MNTRDNWLPICLPAIASSSHVRLTPRVSCGARAPQRVRPRPPARRQLQPVVGLPYNYFGIEAAPNAFVKHECHNGSVESGTGKQVGCAGDQGWLINVTRPGERAAQAKAAKGY